MNLFNSLDDKVKRVFMTDLRAVAKQVGLKPAEIVGAVILVPDEWTPLNGMLTAAQKLKRMDIVKQYRAEIDSVYKKV